MPNLGFCSENLHEIKMRQKFRERSNGLNAISLIGEENATNDAAGTDADNDQKSENDKQGGLVNMKALNVTMSPESSDSFDVGIGSRFSVETNKCDEDEEMMKYIEVQIQNIKGSNNSEINKGERAKQHPRQRPAQKNSQQKQQKRLHDPTIDILHKYITPEEAALMALPDHLKESFSPRSEEMLSNQMLNGIPEVDLGISVRIRNIEDTEDAKHKLFKDRQSKHDMPSPFVPNNMAVNFVQHNRCKFLYSPLFKYLQRVILISFQNVFRPFVDNIANARQKMRRYRQNNDKSDTDTTQKVEGTAPTSGHGFKVKRATDDYYYDKFRKQFRRY